MDELTIVWLTGSSCDGCTIGFLGDTSAVPMEEMLTNARPGMPRIRLIHPLFSPLEGAHFVQQLDAAAGGELGAFVLVVETAVPAVQNAGSYAWIGDRDIAEWLRRLAVRAAAVVALGDCAVYGGPHSGDDLNPTGATGVLNLLGVRYLSTAGYPVIHLPGCCAPPVLMQTLMTIVEHVQGSGEPLQLDELGRPSFASEYRS